MRKYWKAIVNLLLTFSGLLFAGIVLPRVISLSAPFLAGWMIAATACPVVRFFEKNVKIKRKTGSTVVITVATGLIFFALYLLTGRLLREGISLLKNLPELWLGVQQDFQKLSGHFFLLYEKLPEDLQRGMDALEEQVSRYTGQLIPRISTSALETLGDMAKNIPGLFMGIFMAILSAWFFVAERDLISQWFHEHTPESVRARFLLLRRSFRKSAGGYVKAQLKIELWIWLFLVLGFRVMGVRYALVTALIIAFLDFLPFLGTGTVMLPWAIGKLSVGEYRMAAGLFLLWGTGQLIRQLIQPRIVGKSMGMHPLPTLFLLYLGYRLGGIWGMLLAVPLGLMAKSLYEEGAFRSVTDSIRVIAGGLNHFRMFTEEELQEGTGSGKNRESEKNNKF